MNTSPQVIAKAIDAIALPLSISEAEGLYNAATALVARIDKMPHMLLGRALAQVEEDDGDSSAAAIVAAEAIDAMYPDWGGAIKVAVVELLEREDVAARARSAGPDRLVPA